MRLRTLQRLGSLLALALVACSDRTSILVRVVSPLAVPEEVDRLQFAIRGETTSTTVERDVDLQTPFPHTLSIRPGPTESGAVRITVTALRDGAFVMRRVAFASFVRGMQTVVEVVLDPLCRGVRCAEGVDCVAGRCAAETPDAGIDAHLPDSGAPDAGCRSGADCDDSVGCTVDLCTDGVCEHRPDDTLCIEGRTCDPVLGCPLRSCDDDSDCGDGRPCNGVETCDGTTCVPGLPVECDDMDACTTDVCDDSGRTAECRRATRDADGDMHGDAACASLGDVPADDCDDTNPAVFPGQPEECNGIDDDCSGTCDDVFTCCRGASGPCTTSCGTAGTRVCGTTCSWGVCSPPPEACNGIDDDCNGAPDDVFECVQGSSRSCVTDCGSAGTQSCDETCRWSRCETPTERCNGIDDDCNGAPDDVFECVSGTSTPCTTSCGTTGSRRCDPSSCALATECTPPPEGCNGRDDDCDGAVDEGTFECSVGMSGPCTTICGTSGTRTCGATCTWQACVPPDEACNGRDDDCDGRIDETFACVPGSSGPCTTGCGTAGVRTCDASCTWGSCAPPVEACNGVDDDCDAMCDEIFACCAGTMGSCTTSCGTSGTRTCLATCGWSACSPPAETCNGMDDDCNGACDDGFPCCAGRTGACTTSCGSTGSRLCSASCAWGVCAPPPEACNGGDDDCDGRIDEGFACSAGSVGPCPTSCGSTGTRTCDVTCNWGTCVPPAEACNGVDDDCDGMVDEGCGSCIACTGSIAITGSGGRYDQALSSNAQTGSCGGTGAEYTMTFTIASASDVFITTHAAATDTVVYVRACGCTGAEVACNDDADGRNTSVLRLPNLAAGTYQVFVDTNGGTTGTVVPVDVYITAPGASSDRCGNPTAIASGATSITGNTCSFANDYDVNVVSGALNCPYVYDGDAADRVYYFYLPTSRTVTMSACNAGTSYDTVLYVRSVCTDGSPSAQLACNDDNCSGSPTSCTAGLRSALTVSLPAGLYYLFVDGYQETPSDVCPCGPYRLDLTGF